MLRWVLRAWSRRPGAYAGLQGAEFRGLQSAGRIELNDYCCYTMTTDHDDFYGNSGSGGFVEVKDAMGNIRLALKQLEDQGQNLVSTEALRTYLDTLEKDAGVSAESRKLLHESRLAEYKAGRDLGIAMFNAVIGFAQAALKTSLLVNGAAAIALLTFIGNIWTKVQAPAVAQSLSAALVLFCLGALAAALSTATTYLTQYCYQRPRQKTAMTFHMATLVLITVSYAFFGFGIFKTYGAFITHLVH